MSFVTRIARRAILAVTALAVAVPLTFAGSASADQFNIFPTRDGWPEAAGTPLVVNFPFRGCLVTVGPVADSRVPISDPNFRTIGGGRVSHCSTGGHTIAVTVREWAATGSPSTGMGKPKEVGDGVGTTFTNSAGFGSTASGDPRILELNLYCQPPHLYWTTGVYVTIDGVASGYHYSPWSDKKEVGC